MPTPQKRAIFNGFEDFYRQTIAPWLAAQEAARVEAVQSFYMISGLSVLSGATVFFMFPLPLLSHAAMIGAVAGVLFALKQLNAARRTIQDGLIDQIARHAGFTFRGTIERPESCAVLRSLKLLPDFNREEWEDEVSGEQAQTRFTMYEAHLRMRKSNGKHTSTRTVFYGQIIEIEHARAFQGVTVVQRDRGAMNALWKPGREYARVGLAAAHFERAFEAWSTDQVEARYLLDPLVLERFEALERLLEGKALRAVFVDRRILLVIETGDRMTIGTMFKPLNDRARVDVIVAEFETLLDLIDLLVARVDAPLTGPISLADIRRQGAN